jgi:hypothetical protein
MSSDNIQRQIEFILEHQVKFSEDIDRLKEVQSQQTENIGRLFETVSAIFAQSESNRVETRDAINNLIVANEVTRKLSEDVARLVVQHSQRITKLEEKVS